MIEAKNEEFSVKIAESPEEAFWHKLKEQSQKDIETHKHEIIINEAIIELAEKKLNEGKKDG